MPSDPNAPRGLTTGRWLVCCLAFFSFGCGTLFPGGEHEARVSSTPRAAEVRYYALDGTLVAGPAPTDAGPIPLPRPRHQLPYLAVVSKDGYCPAYRITQVIGCCAIAPLDVVLEPEERCR